MTNCHIPWEEEDHLGKKKPPPLWHVGLPRKTACAFFFFPREVRGTAEGWEKKKKKRRKSFPGEISGKTRFSRES